MLGTKKGKIHTFDRSESHEKKKLTIKEKNPYSTNNRPKNIKTLVEIAVPIIDISLSKQYKVNTGIDELIDIEWDLRPFDYHINLIKQKLWTSGDLVANVTYTRRNTRQLFLHKLKIPWKQTCSLTYVHPPFIISKEENKQYDFINRDVIQPTTSTHYEHYLYNDQEPIIEMTSAKITSSYELIKKKSPILALDFNCIMQLEIYQYQKFKYT